ncbi:HEAT repeat domain-containing protein [Georgenia alba]|uniref:HEAT repeat domain-containing protein n=1 Tax=Georgenia alba TaxID=2233858 RepID=A0ABW2QAR7_9MICO
MSGAPPRGAHPRVLLAAASELLGEREVVAWCRRLLSGQERDDDPDLAWLGGTEDWALYWRRVWGARGLLYVWDDDAATVDAVANGLDDEHWRVREMACKVVRARRLSVLAGEVSALRDDGNDRVRAAADRALATLA